MARNKRKSYDDLSDDEKLALGGIPCRECGCRHNYVGKTERIGNVIRRRRHCRNCGHIFYTTESV